MVLLTLILQELSTTSKIKEHSAAIERRLNLWRQGDFDLLLKEVRFIQGKFVNSKKARTVENISKVFARLVFQGNLSAAIKLLDSESSTGLLNLTPEVLDGLKGKHTESADIGDESLLYGPIDYIPRGVFDLIDEKMIFDDATKIKGSAGPSGWMPSYIEEPFAPRISRLGQGFERVDSRFHKKSVKDRLPSIFAGRLYLLQTHSLGQKLLNTT